MTNVASAGIFGFSGVSLTAEERAFFKDVRPYGYILFARNCESPDQVRALTASLRDLHGDASLPILIDQEGGRVARLKPPKWRSFPPAKVFATLAKANLQDATRATYLNARMIAHELQSLGINVNCAPVADLNIPGAHDIIGDRAFGESPEDVAVLAGAQAQGLMDGCVIPVVKHIPGHGRALADSHEALPVVETLLDELKRSDFVPFKVLNHLPMAMTAHVVYTAIDAERPATLSPWAVNMIRNYIGFSGLLMSDDLSMKALSGDFAERTRGALSAGCDVVLHCNGDMQEMQAIAHALPPMSAQALGRSEKAFARVAMTETDLQVAEMELKALLNGIAAA